MRKTECPSPPQDAKTEQESKHSLESPQRRKTIKTMVGGGVALAAYHVLPDSWERPLIEQVFLPAHAATSGVTLNDPCMVSLDQGTTASSAVVIRVEGYVTPPVNGLAVLVVATPSGAGASASGSATTSSTGAFSLQMTVSGGPGITAVSVQTTVTGASGVSACAVSIPEEGTPATTSTPTSTSTSTSTTTSTTTSTSTTTTTSTAPPTAPPTEPPTTPPV